MEKHESGCRTVEFSPTSRRDDRLQRLKRNRFCEQGSNHFEMFGVHGHKIRSGGYVFVEGYLLLAVQVRGPREREPAHVHYCVLSSCSCVYAGRSTSNKQGTICISPGLTQSPDSVYVTVGGRGILRRKARRHSKTNKIIRYLIV